jgi:hypothetical protein
MPASSSSASSTTAPTVESTARPRAKVLGTLSEVAAYTTEHRVREVYITLPLGSQPRIVELLEQLQDTTASLFFVPDVFGISIIQGRLQDMNGVPVVGICETPFTGTNQLVKRISDIIIASVIIVLISPLAAGDRDRRQAQLAGAGAVQAAPQRASTATRSSSTSSARCAPWKTAKSSARRPATTPA